MTENQTHDLHGTRTTSTRRTNRRRRIGAAAAVSIAAVTATGTLAAPTSSAAPDPVNQQLRRDVAAMVSTNRTVGVVLDIESPARTIEIAGGVSNLTSGAPASTEAHWRVASVTKAMVATLVMQQVEKGVWRQDTTVEQIWPGLLPGHGDVTLRQLMAHRSGIPDYLGELLEHVQTIPQLRDAIARPLSHEQILRSIRSQEWFFPSSNNFAYSNSGYVVLGMLLEKQSGQYLATLLNQRIFAPAGMTRAQYDLDPGIPAPMLSEFAVGERPYALWQFNPQVFRAAGAVVATSDDIQAFYTALLSGRLLRQDLVDVMLAPKSPLSQTDGLAYGYGIYQLDDPCVPGQKLYGHDGASLGTLTQTLHTRDAQRRVTVGWTGRRYDLPPTAPQPAVANLLTDAILASCTPAQASAARAGLQRDGAKGAPTSLMPLTLPQLDAKASNLPPLR